MLPQNQIRAVKWLGPLTIALSLCICFANEYHFHWQFGFLFSMIPLAAGFCLLLCLKHKYLHCPHCGDTSYELRTKLLDGTLVLACPHCGKQILVQ